MKPRLGVAFRVCPSPRSCLTGRGRRCVAVDWFIGDMQPGCLGGGCSLGGAGGIFGDFLLFRHGSDRSIRRRERSSAELENPKSKGVRGLTIDGGWASFEW